MIDDQELYDKVKEYKEINILYVDAYKGRGWELQEQV
jgi:hypothetical protein